MRVMMLCVVVGLGSARASADPLTGNWKLNLAKTRYGPGVDVRARETFTCTTRKGLMTCAIHSVRANGRTVSGGFSAAYDGKPYPTTGMPDVSQVVLRKIDDLVAEATFSSQGQPVFAYRATKSRDGRQLTIVAVDPVTRAPLTSVVVYDRQVAAQKLP